MQVQDDFFVEQKIITQSINKYLDHVEQPSIEHIIESAIQINGLYSFNKLNSKFNSIKAPYEWI